MSLPWMRTLEQRGPIVGSTSAPSKRRKQHKDIVYPAFVKCAEMEDSSSEWKELFDDLSRGILPKGFSVRNRTLAYTDNYKTKPIRMDIETSELREQLIELFSSKKGFVRKKSSEDSIDPTIIPEGWDNVKKKISRRLYILDYVCDKGREMGWTDDEVDTAYAQVSDWLDMGYVRQNEVVMESGNIKSVADVVIEKEGVILRAVDLKRRAPIQRIHVSRLYQPLRRVVVKRDVQEDVRKEDTSTVS